MAYNRPFAGGYPPPNSNMFNQSPHPNLPLSPQSMSTHQYGNSGAQFNRNPNVWNVPPHQHPVPHMGHQQSMQHQNISPWINNNVPTSPQFRYQPQPLQYSPHSPNMRMNHGNKRPSSSHLNSNANNSNKRNRTSTSNNNQNNHNQNNNKQQGQAKSNKNQNNQNNRRNWNKNRNFKRRNQANANREVKINDKNKSSTGKAKEISVENVDSTKTDQQDLSTKTINDEEQLNKYFENITGMICKLCNVFLKSINDAKIHCLNTLHRSKVEAEKEKESAAAKNDSETEKSANDTATSNEPATTNTSGDNEKQESTTNNEVLEQKSLDTDMTTNNNDNPTETKTDDDDEIKAENNAENENVISDEPVNAELSNRVNSRGGRGGNRGGGRVRGGRRGRGRR